MNKRTNKSQVKCQWSHMVGSCSVDQNTNSLSLFNIIEEINGEARVQSNDNKPINILPLSYELVSLWERIGSTGKELIDDIKIDLLDPDRKVVQSLEYKLVIPADKERMRFIANAQHIKLTNNGKYIFSIKLKVGSKYQEVSNIPVLINIKKTIID